MSEYLGTQRFYQPRDPVAGFGEGARLYGRCRRADITVYCLSARVAIEHDLMLLRDDRDFEKMAEIVPDLAFDCTGLYSFAPSGVEYRYETREHHDSGRVGVCLRKVPRGPRGSAEPCVGGASGPCRVFGGAGLSGGDRRGN